MSPTETLCEDHDTAKNHHDYYGKGVDAADYLAAATATLELTDILDYILTISVSFMQLCGRAYTYYARRGSWLRGKFPKFPKLRLKRRRKLGDPSDVVWEMSCASNETEYKYVALTAGGTGPPSKFSLLFRLRCHVNTDAFFFCRCRCFSGPAEALR